MSRVNIKAKIDQVQKSIFFFGNFQITDILMVDFPKDGRKYNLILVTDVHNKILV